MPRATPRMSQNLALIGVAPQPSALHPSHQVPMPAPRPTAPRPPAPRPTAPRPTAPRPTAPRPTAPGPLAGRAAWAPRDGTLAQHGTRFRTRPCPTTSCEAVLIACALALTTGSTAATIEHTFRPWVPGHYRAAGR